MEFKFYKKQNKKGPCKRGSKDTIGHQKNAVQITVKHPNKAQNKQFKNHKKMYQEVALILAQN